MEDLKYFGVCPARIANSIKLHGDEEAKIGRVNAMDILFKDSRY